MNALVILLTGLKCNTRGPCYIFRQQKAIASYIFFQNKVCF